MSDLMLLGVLQMPPELWNDSPLDICQRYSRYMEAASRIESDAAELAALRADAERDRWLTGNALIEFTAPHGRVFHDGKVPASARHPLDLAIDAARKEAP